MKFKRTKRQTLFGTLVKFKRLVPSNEYYMELLEMKSHQVKYEVTVFR